MVRGLSRGWVLGAGCWVLGSGAATLHAQTTPRPGTQHRAPSPRLPTIPAARGPLQIRVIYPLPRQRITASDSTFVFGSVGNGDAGLTINGLPFEVAPNGAFLAWLPIPADTAPVFRFVARLGADSVMDSLRVRMLDLVTNPDTGLWVDRGSITPSGTVWVEPGEPLRVSVTATPNALVTLEQFGQPSILLVPDTSERITYGPFDTRVTRTPATETRYVGVLPARPVGIPLGDPPTVPRTPPPAADSATGAIIRVATTAGAIQVPMRLRVGLIDPAHRPVVILDDDTARLGNTDGAVAATPTPSGTFHWFFPNGTPATVSGRNENQVRLRLSETSSAWVDISSIASALPDGTPDARGTLRLVRLAAQPGFVSARFALSRRVPFRVEEDGDRIMVRLYGTQVDMDWVQYGSTDSLVERVTWDQATRDEGVVTFLLSKPVFGYRFRWDGSALILDIRRPPVISRAAPLRGRVIAIDPGHPPAGATGPTGLREAEANLAVGLVLQRMLERAGARVIMTRTTDTASGLYDRTNIAERGDAEVLVSIHNNAFPDGVNPWENNGTSTYYYQPRSERLARRVQEGLVRETGLRNLGFGRGDLALVRPTWMPAVLTEGAFLMIPEQENALRTPAFQQRYARAVMSGIEAWLRELAGR